MGTMPEGMGQKQGKRHGNGTLKTFSCKTLLETTFTSEVIEGH